MGKNESSRVYYRFGTHLVEDTKNIYHFVNLYTSGGKKVSNVLDTADSRGDDTIVMLKDPVICQYGSFCAFIVNSSCAS